MPAPVPPLRAIIFDLDDTLTPSSRAYERALESCGLSGASESFLKARSSVKSRLGPGHVSSRNRLLYFKAMLEDRGAFSAQAALDLMDCYERALSFEFRRAWDELGREAQLRKFNEKYSVGLITNENARTQLVKLRAIDPRGELFKAVVISEEFGVEKPAPRLFREMLGRLGAEPSACVMVGDNVEADCEPALELGMRAVLTREFLKSGARPSGVPVIERLEGLWDVL